MVTMVEPGLSLGDGIARSFGMVDRVMVPHVWPQVEPILQTKAKQWLERVSEVEIFGWLCDGTAELWLGIRDGVVVGFVIGHWEVHDRDRRYVILYIAGEGLEGFIAQGLAKLEQYCCMLGGSELVLEGRRGWLRWLKKYGYSQTAVRMRKPTRVLWRN